jgi:hypothetical protein
MKVDAKSIVPYPAAKTIDIIIQKPMFCSPDVFLCETKYCSDFRFDLLYWECDLELGNCVIEMLDYLIKPDPESRELDASEILMSAMCLELEILAEELLDFLGEDEGFYLFFISNAKSQFG